MKYRIPYNKPHLTGKEIRYFTDAVNSGKLSGNGKYTRLCQEWFETEYGFRKCLLTTSCTDALEMCALLCDIHPGDEVIVPSYTFVSSALAFVREGAKIMFADSMDNSPDIDCNSLESLVCARTKVIVVVHYAGIACDMDRIMDIAQRNGIIVVEDAAQAIGSYYKGKRLGTIGHLSAFSFHETKNISTGEGGMLGINDGKFMPRAEILWEKGTNRADFSRGYVSRYEWMDKGSSFLPGESMSAMLWAQLEELEDIQSRRTHIWNLYRKLLEKGASQDSYELPYIPEYGSNNGSIFYIICASREERDDLIKRLGEKGILAVFHYLPLHESPYCRGFVAGQKELPNCGKYAGRLLRLPLYYDLADENVEEICGIILEYYNT